MRRIPFHGLILATVAAVAALLLTIIRPAPEGLIRLGLGDREVRAAPGQSISASTKHDLTALDIVSVTLVRVSDAYVDPTRIDPKKMLYAALDSVQLNIPEVLVEPHPDQDRLVVVVNDKKKSFSTKDVDSSWRLAAHLKQIFRFIEAHMNPGADLAQVEYAAINGMLTTLDPHSVLLDPETAREMDVNTSGKFGGLGIVVGMRDRKLTVLRPMKGTPAYRAGIKRGDYIVKINDELTENLTLQESVDRMRGEPDTSVTLWMERKGSQDLLRFDINRALIQVDSVQSRMLGNKVGYIRLSQFSGRSVDEVREAMEALEDQGAQSWILDLRWNPGGLLEQAIKVADLFVDKGTIVTTVGGRERDPRRAQRKGTNKLPMAVLVNGSSASASEIVAGALKNLDRAVVIGSSTFGKGSVQVLYDNKDGSKLKLTIAQYLTPGDRSIQSLGIVPDIELQRMLVPEKNTTFTDYLRLLPPSRTYRESDLRAHLTSRYANATDKPAYQLPFVYEPPADRDSLTAGNGNSGESAEELLLEDEEPIEDFVEDFEIRLARDLVTQVPVAGRPSMLDGAKALLAKHKAIETGKLSKALAALGVDWSAAPSDKKEPAARLAFEVSADASEYLAGDLVRLTGKVTNHGSGTAYRVHARVKSANPAFEDTELIFGRVAPGETRTWTAHVRVPEDALDRVDNLSFEFREARNQVPVSAPLQLRIKASDRPVFAYSHQLLDSGNGDGLVQKGEQHRLRVTIKNIGKGIAAQPTALLRNASGDGILLKKARFELDPLWPGQSQEVEFVFDVRDALQDDEAVVEMTVYDSTLHESVVEKLHYPVHKPSAGPAKASGSVKVVGDSTLIHEGASQDAAPIATATKGSLFRVTGKQGAWYRVALDDGRPGFVTEPQVRPANARAAKAQVQPIWQVTPPAITLDIPSYVTDQPSYSLSGKAVDDTHVEDIYVFVSNFDDQVENRKVFYKSNRNGKQSDALSFQTEIPLWPGTNQITVVARENDEVKSSHTMYIYRTETGTMASAPSSKP